MKRKLIAILTAVAISVAAMSSSVFAVTETDAVNTSSTSTTSQISSDTIGNIDTEEVDLEQQRIILQRQREFEANLAAAAAAEVRAEVSFGKGPPDFENAIPAPELVDVLAELNSSQLDSKGTALSSTSPYHLVTVFESSTIVRQAVVDSTRAVISGWSKENGKWYYYALGSKIQGWRLIGGEWYWFNKDYDDNTANDDPYMVHGWHWDYDYDAYYYLGVPGDPDSGNMYTGGWLNDTENGGTAASPKKYYLGSDGIMVHGWLEIGTKWYYMGHPGAPASGLLYTFGWLQDSEQTPPVWYYLDKNTGVRYEEEWYTDDKGTPTDPSDDLKYYFDSNGQMLALEWLDFGGNKYYFNASGSMATGPLTIGSYKYFFRNTGAVYRGWFTVGAYTYHANVSSGILSIGTVTMGSPYVSSVFDDDGKLLADIITTKTSNIHGYPTNIRWGGDNLEVSGGHRGPSLTVNCTELLPEDQIIVGQAIAAYNGDARGVSMTTTTNGNPSILMRYDVTGVYTNGALANSICKREDGHAYEYVEGGVTTGEIFANTIYFGDTPAFPANITRKLVIHEMGHSIGLRHTYEPSERGVYNPDEDPGIVAVLHPINDAANCSDYFENYDYSEIYKTYPE